MLRRVSSFLLIMIIVLALGVPVYSYPNEDDGLGASGSVVKDEKKEAVNSGGILDEGAETEGKTTEGETAGGETTQDKTTPDKKDEDKTTGKASPSSPSSDKAAPKLGIDDVISSNNIASTRQFQVTITRPKGDENTFKKSFVICGFTDKSDIRVSLARYNESVGKYESFKNVDGESSWDIGSSGVFTKEVILKEGSNKLKLVVFKKADIDNLELDVNLQVNYFTINVLKESIKDKIVNSVLKITEIFDKIEQQLIPTK